MTLIFTQTAYHTPETPDYRMIINRSEFMSQYHEDKNALPTKKS